VGRGGLFSAAQSSSLFALPEGLSEGFPVSPLANDLVAQHPVGFIKGPLCKITHARQLGLIHSQASPTSRRSRRKIPVKMTGPRPQGAKAFVSLPEKNPPPLLLPSFSIAAPVTSRDYHFGAVAGRTSSSNFSFTCCIRSALSGPMIG